MLNGHLAASRCSCGNFVDKHFGSRLLLASPQIDRTVSCVADGLTPRCRSCRVFWLLHQGLEVDKYCYGTTILKARRAKVLRLSADNEELVISAQRSSSSRPTRIPIRDLHGVIFGAYTCTFKKQSASNLPPNWAAFSLIGELRSFDFSARSPEVVECCVLGLQQIVWERRQVEKAQALAISALRNTFAFPPWPPGFFLWMRLRFRLQEHACKRVMSCDHLLWIVFMRCAFSSHSELTKGRFIVMAEKLSQESFATFDPTQSAVGPLDKSGEIAKVAKFPGRAKLKFQADRVKAICDDQYHCPMQTFLPGAPKAMMGGCDVFPIRRMSFSLPSSHSAPILRDVQTILNDDKAAVVAQSAPAEVYHPTAAGSLLMAFDEGAAEGLDRQYSESSSQAVHI